jgi:hypothetical protein
MKIWCRKFLFDENIVHLWSCDWCELNILVNSERTWVGGRRRRDSRFTLVTENGNRFYLDVWYARSLGFVEASSQVSDVRDEDVHTDTVR